MNATDVRTELGSRFDDLIVVSDMPLTLQGRLAWAHDFVGNPALSAAFKSLPGTGFTVYGAPIPQNSALTSVGAELFITPRLTLLAKFDGEFAPGLPDLRRLRYPPLSVVNSITHLRPGHVGLWTMNRRVL